jgi:hypothetical protein
MAAILDTGLLPILTDYANKKKGDMKLKKNLLL